MPRGGQFSTAVDRAFDEPNLVVSAGLVPAVRLAVKVGLPDLAPSM